EEGVHDLLLGELRELRVIGEEGLPLRGVDHPPDTLAPGAYGGREEYLVEPHLSRVKLGQSGVDREQGIGPEVAEGAEGQHELPGQAELKVDAYPSCALPRGPERLGCFAHDRLGEVSFEESRDA